MGFSLRQLRYFVAVAEAGRFSAAARDLYVSQSTVTTAIQDLERHLGHATFERSVRGVELTVAGRTLLPKARQILELVEEAETYTASDADITGRLRVGASYTVMGYFLPQHIPRITARFPGVDFEWRELDRTAIEAELLNGDLDIGVLLTSNLRSEGLAYQALVRSPRRLWVAPSHPLASAIDVRLSDVRGYPYAMLTVDESETSTRAYWPELQPDVFVSTSSLEAIRSLVGNGSAVTVLSDMVYRPWSLEGHRIQPVTVADPIPDMQVGVAWSRGRTDTTATAALRQYFSALS